jgi:N-acetylmuramoyl-L-alanine amidase
MISPTGQAAQTSMLAVRVWPARDYTRVTLESRSPVNFTHQTVRNPERLVVDLEGVELNDILQSLPSKISGQDPYIQLIRAGRNRPGVVRLVIELKAEVTPQVFTLAPVGEYGHRLVLDLYPVEPVDPLLALLEKISPEEAAAAVPARRSAATSPAPGRRGNTPQAGSPRQARLDERPTEPNPAAAATTSGSAG